MKRHIRMSLCDHLTSFTKLLHLNEYRSLRRRRERGRQHSEIFAFLLAIIKTELKLPA